MGNTTEAQQLLNRFSDDQNHEGALSLLTPEEREVALLLIEGDTRRDIARKLHLSASEVSHRINSIRDDVQKPSPALYRVTLFLD